MSPHATLLISSLFLLAPLVPPAHADEQVRTLQEELRRRNSYFGNVDGRRTPELEEAVRRYQKRKGLDGRGADDRETLQSLGVVERAPDEPPPRSLDWPAEPVLRSDAVIDVQEAALRIAEETGVAPEAVGAPPPGPSRKAAAAARTPAARKRSTPQVRTAAATKPARPARRSFFRSSRQPNQRVEPAEIRDFLKNFVKAMNCSDVARELQFYADQVNYFHNGEIDRRIVERTLRDYYERWPKRSYRLDREVSYIDVPERGEIVVIFHIRFELRNGDRKVEGVTANTFIINAATADPRIVSIQERRVRS